MGDSLYEHVPTQDAADGLVDNREEQHSSIYSWYARNEYLIAAWVTNGQAFITHRVHASKLCTSLW